MAAMEPEPAMEAELAALQSEIAALRAELPPEPELAPPGVLGAAEDWSWVTARACTDDKRIGDGAGCVGVYRLDHPVTGEAFAIKVVDRMQHHGSTQAKHNFEREVDIFNRLRHPGICRLR